MRPFKEIKRDMRYPSAEVKTQCMNEVARYLRDAAECGDYSGVFGKLLCSRYHFGIDSKELMELLSNKYGCRELCGKAVLLKEMYAEELGLDTEDDLQEDLFVPADMKYRFICEQVMEKELDYDKLTCEDVDAFVVGTEDIKVPGVLYPLMWMTHADNEKVFLYIYNKYVLPAFIKLGESGSIDRYDSLNSLMCGYIEELIIHVLGEGNVFFTTLLRETSWNDVILEFKKSGEFECIRQANEKLKDAPGIGIKLYKFHKENRKRIKKKYQTYMFDYYPMFSGLVLFALLGESKNEQAVEYMIDNYSDISEGNRQCAYVLILLFRTILLAENYEYMNILYADLQKEKLLYQRNVRYINDAITQSCDFIEELYGKIGIPREKKYFEEHRRFVRETVFENWGMLQDIRNIKDGFSRAKDNTKADMFRRIYDVMKALSNDEGIYIALIGQVYGKNYRESRFIKEKHHDDKVAMVISWEDAEKAGKLYKKLCDIEREATSIRNRSFFERVDIIIKDILLGKLDEDILSMLASVRELREKADFSDREDDFYSAIEPSINSLTKRISAKYIDRNRIVNYFVKLDGDMGCWDKLDDECRNMMITAEIVYETLIAREDRDKLDYSPSMIPLTKVIESLLNGIYSRIRGNIVFSGPGMNIDNYSVNFFKEKYASGPRDFLEMGPAIKMLGDGFLKIDGVRLAYGSYYLPAGRSRFGEWQGNRQVDWNRLGDFAGITLKCSGFETDSPIVQFTLGNNMEFNRKIFIGALEYIKNTYRNKVAHKEGIDRQKMDECRQNMLIAQKLIWMLIHIIR